MTPILVTGATGRVGGAVARDLVAGGHTVRAAVREERGEGEPWQEAVVFSFADPKTWTGAFEGVEAMFVMRPPQIANVARDMLPALEAAKGAGVRRMVLSVQGAQRNPLVPHYRLERWLRASGLQWTFVRSGFFMQNLSTTHAEIRETDTLSLPAGHGSTSFVDIVDVAAICARALTGETLAGQALTPTGALALSYDDVACVLSAVLGRPIRYRALEPWAYWQHTRASGLPGGQAAVMFALYSACRLGLASAVTTDVQGVLGREPIDLLQFARREHHAWQRPNGAAHH
ncbi:NmrA family NAD(P)-binding protein [Streptacidiphilus sp. PAMC 29251]